MSAGQQHQQQYVCIRRPEASLSNIFEDMYLNERLVDVTLSCYDGQLQAHRLVLAACSTYFSGLFDKLANPFHYPVVVIKDMRIEDLKLIVEFMYKGQLTVSQDRLMSLIKCAENLQINGLTNSSATALSGLALQSNKLAGQKLKRAKKHSNSPSSSSVNISHHQAIMARSYGSISMSDHQMQSGESLDESQHQFSYSSNDPTSTRNLNNQAILNPSPSTMNAQHLISIDHQGQQQHQQGQQLNNQLQVLSHSLSANKSSLGSTATSNQLNAHQLGSQQSQKGRTHPCNICWKTFREKANLKRHLQVHSIDRVIYACPDCNKTFSWKDNYIRHTKTAHHMNNARQQT